MKVFGDQISIYYVTVKGTPYHKWGIKSKSVYYTIPPPNQLLFRAFWKSIVA